MPADINSKLVVTYHDFLQSARVEVEDLAAKAAEAAEAGAALRRL